MIRPTDALLLARTKLKVRKIRLIVTVFISSLLFAALFFLMFVSSGAIQSLKDFGKEGYGGRYFVEASIVGYQPSGPDDKTTIDKFSATQRDLVAKKKQAAKKLDISYDDSIDASLPLSVFKSGPGGETITVPNYQSPLIAEDLKNRNKAIEGSSFEDFSETAKQAGAITTFLSTRQNGFSFGTNGSTSVIVNGKEDMSGTSQFNSEPSFSGVKSINSVGWRSQDEALIQPFVLPGESLELGKDGSIPIIAPFSAAEEILGLKALPQTATTAQKRQRLIDVREKIAGTTALLCYRNSASGELVAQAVQQAKEIDANKNKKDYTKPPLIYAVPAEPCGAATVKSDTRSAEEKKQANNQKAFDEQFGNYKAPFQGLVTIRIIGLSPDMQIGPSVSATNIITSVFTSSLGTSWVSPLKAVETNQLAQTIQGGSIASRSPAELSYYAEFKSLDAMEKLIKDQTCQGLQTYNTPTGQIVASGPTDPAVACIAQNKPYTVNPYGNSAGAIEQFRKTIWKIARFAILAIVIIASLIMMGNVGKIIADGRRETAVFRSLGAKRFDIVQIYMTYALLVCTLVILFSAVIGFAGAMYVNRMFSPDLSISAVITFNAQDVDKKFLLMGFNPMYTAAIAVLVLLSGLLSTAVPLLTNMRRNPIRDMRDDT